MDKHKLETLNFLYNLMRIVRDEDCIFDTQMSEVTKLESRFHKGVNIEEASGKIYTIKLTVY